jgi:hypothetical protein
VSDGLTIVSMSKMLHVRATGKLRVADYELFAPAMEALIREPGKVRILFEMHSFKGWTAGALWEDVKFDFKHFTDIDRLAIVGESEWEHGMAIFCRPFTTAAVRYFNRDQIGEAKAWLAAGQSVNDPGS